MPGCVQAALAPEIDPTVARLLARRNIELVPLEGAGCCGSLVHHLGRSEDAKNWARRAIEAFERGGGAKAFEGVLITATGCASHLKDLAHLFLDDPHWLPRARAFAASTRDLLDLLKPETQLPQRHVRVAWHAACSLQNGLKLTGRAEALLRAAGFDVVAIPDGHLCCGSAGSYSVLQPQIAGALRARKLETIAPLGADLLATSNVGCLQHLAGPDAPPVVHLAELLDWAEGGTVPVALRDHDR
ncbi:MAG TPA: heterodisulfide reductase-related iron-sulfur binding cluster [Steroidobacteraceae bacterium]